MKLESPKEKESNGCEPLFFPSLLHLLYTKHDLQLVLLEEKKEKKNPPKKVHFQLLFQLLLQDRREEWLRCNKVGNCIIEDAGVELLHILDHVFGVKPLHHEMKLQNWLLQPHGV